MLKFLATLLLFLIAALVFAGYLVDPNDYKDEIQDKFAAATGHEPVISGPMRGDLFPEPVLEIMLVRGHVDYRFEPRFVEPSKGLGIKELEGIPIPVHLTGPFDHPRWNLDLESALSFVRALISAFVILVA